MTKISQNWSKNKGKYLTSEIYDLYYIEELTESISEVGLLQPIIIVFHSIFFKFGCLILK